MYYFIIIDLNYHFKLSIIRYSMFIKWKFNFNIIIDCFNFKFIKILANFKLIMK